MPERIKIYALFVSTNNAQSWTIESHGSKYFIHRNCIYRCFNIVIIYRFVWMCIRLYIKLRGSFNINIIICNVMISMNFIFTVLIRTKILHMAGMFRCLWQSYILIPKIVLFSKIVFYCFSCFALYFTSSINIIIEVFLHFALNELYTNTSCV